ncbi:MAG TPA: penicillin-binding transpeptidase domain-containing protein, partial [Vicinamibacteria bacterium]|nr:penicillin-binding transpeptidase domain-containing protein [Vicinamibacteria bacterium]
TPPLVRVTFIAMGRLRVPALLCLGLLVGLARETGADAPASARPRRRRTTVTRTPRPLLPSLVVPASASTRDLEIGEACRRGLEGTSGAVVAMDPYTGRVMALVNPTRGMATAYQPCSVFKIVVAIAGLTEGVITPATTYNCTGGCWFWPGHGIVDLRQALAQSCNPYFAHVGELLGYERVHHYAELLGLGNPSGINLAGEASGRIPVTVQPSQVGHLSSHAAGIATSAVQLAVVLSATVNGGVIFQPQVSGPDAFVPKERWRLPPGTVLGGLADGFLSAVNEGSASSAFDPDVEVAGKTGTCSGVGWFASYAPADHPEVVIVVFVGPGSGHVASAVGGRIYRNLYKPAAPSLTGGK